MLSLRDNTRAEDIQAARLRRGLVVTTQGAQVLLLPALTIERRVASKGLDILEANARRILVA